MTLHIGTSRRGMLAGLTAIAANAPSLGHAQVSAAANFPGGRVTLVVPFPPDASTDVTMRVMADELGQMWSQPVIVENKGGANGIIAAGTAPEIAAKLEGMGGGVSFTTPEGLMDFTKSEIESWRKVIRAANIKIE